MVASIEVRVRGWRGETRHVVALLMAAGVGMGVAGGGTPAGGRAASGAAAGRFTPDGNMERRQVPDPFKWSLAPLFESDAAFEPALGQQARARARLATFAGRLADPGALADCLDLYFETRRLTNRLSLYGNLRRVTDEAAPDGQRLRDRGLAALNALMADAGFIRVEVVRLSDAAMAAAYAAEPRLAAYRPYLDELRRRRSRVLGAEAERVLALAGDNLWAEIDLNEIPSDFEKAYDGIRSSLPLPKITDESGRQVQLNLTNYGKFRSSKDRRVRRAAVAGLFGALRSQQDALAGTLAGQMRLDVFFARARGYETALDAYMDKENVSVAVYRNLLAALHDNVQPLHDYVELRKQVLGLDDLHLYDLYTPLVPGDTRAAYPYTEAQRILPEALAPLGPDYVKTLKQGMDLANGWIDLYPNARKESGAFSVAVYGIHPFVKMNYYDDHDGLSTLAHEMGHALHSVLSAAKQPYVTSPYANFLAEIASTVNEKLLADYLLAHAKSDDERLSILNKLVETLRTTIYRQALFAEFELLMHEAAEDGTPITAEFANRTYRGLIARYYGPGYTIDADDEVEWGYIAHFYYKYYVYAYATGLSAGVALAERIGSGDPAKRDAYLGMLSAGSSKPPLEILKDAGVDLARPDAIVAAARLMGKSVRDMRAILVRKGTIK